MGKIGDAIKNLKAFEAKVVAKALEDDEFRKKLLDNPKATLTEAAGKDLPEGIVVRVQEEEANSLTIMLPRKPAAASAEGELSDEALEKAAGGIGGIVAVTVITEVGVAAIAEV